MKETEEEISNISHLLEIELIMSIRAILFKVPLLVNDQFVGYTALYTCIFREKSIARFAKVYC